MDTSFNMFRETEVPEGEVIISRTDLDGVITFANDAFAAISGYTPEELVGREHNILRHPDMPRSVFRELWKTIRSGESWEGYIKNRCKDGGYYWVHANISGVYREGKLVEYKSLRTRVEPGKRREMQSRYDAQRMEEGDRVRVVGYIPAATYRRLEREADAEGIGFQELITRKLGR